MKLATTIIGNATDDIIEKGRKIASFLLETGEIDIEFEGGRYRVAGTDREVGIFEVAAAAVTREDLSEDLRGPLAGISDQTLPVASFPYGTQVCEVEVDPETGEVEIVRYAAVDDVGRAINPLILHGQTHGGIAQGAGQALLEAPAGIRNPSSPAASSKRHGGSAPNVKTGGSQVPPPTTIGLPNIGPGQLWLVEISPKASEFPSFEHRAFVSTNVVIYDRVLGPLVAALPLGNYAEPVTAGGHAADEVISRVA